MIDLIRALLACNHSDPNRNRAGAGRWITVNVPADLWQRLGAAVAERPDLLDTAPASEGCDWPSAVNLARNVVRGCPTPTPKGCRLLAIAVLGADQDRCARLKMDGEPGP